MSEGASEDIQCTISENAGVLKFDSHGFELLLFLGLSLSSPSEVDAYSSGNSSHDQG